MFFHPAPTSSGQDPRNQSRQQLEVVTGKIQIFLRRRCTVSSNRHYLKGTFQLTVNFSTHGIIGANELADRAVKRKLSIDPVRIFLLCS